MSKLINTHDMFLDHTQNIPKHKSVSAKSAFYNLPWMYNHSYYSEHAIGFTGYANIKK